MAVTRQCRMTRVKYRTGSIKNELQKIYGLGDKPVKNESYMAHIVCSTFNMVDKVIEASRLSVRKAGESIKHLSEKIDEARGVPESMKTYQENILSLLKFQRNLTYLMYIAVPLIIVCVMLFCTNNIHSKKKLMETTNMFTDSYWYTNDMNGIAVSHINLPTEVNGVEITWSSSDDVVITPQTGSVHLGQYDQNVILKADFTYGSCHTAKAYNLNVLHDPDYKGDDKNFNRLKVSQISDSIYNIDFAQAIMFTNSDVLKFLEEFDLSLGAQNVLSADRHIVSTAYDNSNKVHIYNVEGDLGNSTVYYTLYCNANFIPTRVDRSEELWG